MPKHLGGENQTMGEISDRARRTLGPLPHVDLGWPFQCYCGSAVWVRYRGRFYSPCGIRYRETGRMAAAWARTTLPLTEPQRRALEFLRDKGPLMPSELADLMWPDTRSRTSNVGGYGSVAGTGTNLKAGQFLMRLHDLGYSRYWWDGPRRFHQISALGQKALDQAGTPS